MGDWSNKRRNQKVPRIQWKWKDNLPESVRNSKGCAKGKVYGYKCLHYKKTETSQINNLISTLSSKKN
jgi:hypothetical protein